MSSHTTACIETMFDKANSAAIGEMHGLPGAIAVAENAPLVVAPEFPPLVMRCPHGVRVFAYPNQERIDALRALNRGEQP